MQLDLENLSLTTGIILITIGLHLKYGPISLIIGGAVLILMAVILALTGKVKKDG